MRKEAKERRGQQRILHPRLSREGQDRASSPFNRVKYCLENPKRRRPSTCERVKKSEKGSARGRNVEGWMLLKVGLKSGRQGSSDESSSERISEKVFDQRKEG